MDDLVKKFKKQTPTVTPIWDVSVKSIDYNDICLDISEFKISLYIASFKAIWAGLYEPSVFEKTTLWKNTHDSDKIARIINHWDFKQALSPIFLVKHGSKELGLVADGKHRLTVARYMGCETMPFMVPSTNCDWVSIAVPSAYKIWSIVVGGESHNEKCAES